MSIIPASAMNKLTKETHINAVMEIISNEKDRGRYVAIIDKKYDNIIPNLKEAGYNVSRSDYGKWDVSWDDSDLERIVPNAPMKPASVHISAPPASVPISAPPASVPGDESSDVYDQYCCICFTADIDSKWSECGHENFCFECLRGVKQCPLCRAEGHPVLTIKS